MSERLNYERGERHNKFRKEILELTQSELANTLKKSQSTISNLDKGQDIPISIKSFYTEHDIDWNWYYTGFGKMTRNSKRKESINHHISFDEMERRISESNTRKVTSDKINELIENYNHLKEMTIYSDQEKANLYERILDSIIIYSNK